MTSSTSKVAVITGGSRGIGRAVAEALIKRGDMVVIGDMLDKEGQALVDRFNEEAQRKVSAYVHTDVTKYADLKRLFAVAASDFGGVDIAVLNAGIASNGNALFTPMDDDREMDIFNVNIGGIVRGTKVALMHMIKRGGGVILMLVDTDLMTMPRDIEPYKTLHRVAPKVAMGTVVEAFLKCINNETLTGGALLALPDGVHHAPPSKSPDCCYNKETTEIYLKLDEQETADAKQRLTELSRRFHEE
ncbi:3-alpha-(or 20-beta)-hydroxysteroid dehydrogenase [Apophysomyces sp. BC1034]|nr:3-alpha-(or 20-beta)-hydroxysteroid dehydrogenase [Apophysomyces sp. BC1015]KAG0183376.1 3-alpha-(or 20-beta)-hydroxysteroid dehydrogenase [Apophysomyces sp. BC1021]KAG0194606.1 3-alpha-(or 20-beta)-hydroxysteroid dehydrogenase [Apophysomyces sp. BC1034]